MLKPQAGGGEKGRKTRQLPFLDILPHSDHQAFSYQKSLDRSNSRGETSEGGTKKTSRTESSIPIHQQRGKIMRVKDGVANEVKTETGAQAKGKGESPGDIELRVSKEIEGGAQAKRKGESGDIELRVSKETEGGAQAKGQGESGDIAPAEIHPPDPCQLMLSMCNYYLSRYPRTVLFFLGSAVWTGLSEYITHDHTKRRMSSAVFPVALMEKYCESVKTDELDLSFATPEALIVLSLLAPAITALLGALHSLQQLESTFGKPSLPTTEFKTFAEYQIARTNQEVARKAERSKLLGFAAMHLVLALAVLVDYTVHINQAAVGSSVMCMATKVLVAPLFKAFAVSMWTVLMTVTNFVHWEVSRSKSPKEVIDKNLIPARERPLNRNIVTDILVFTTAVVLTVWICAALIVSPALVGFFPVVLVLLVALPMLILVLPLKIVSMLSQKMLPVLTTTHREKPKESESDTTGVEELLHKEPLLLLKIGLMQTFTTVMLLSWFGGVYYGGETWTTASKILASDVSRMIAALPAMLYVSFQWPTFSINFEISFYLFACSIGMLVVEYILKFVAWLDNKLGDNVPVSHQASQNLRTSMQKMAIKCLYIVGDKPMIPFRWLTHAIATRRTKQVCYDECSNEMVESYALNNPEQQTFDLSGCVRLTDQALWAIALPRTNVNTDKYVHRLRLLSINTCNMVTNNGLLSFANTGTKIDEVRMVGVNKVTIAAVAKLLIECEVEAKDLLSLHRSETWKHDLDTALGGSEPSTASGKTRIFIAAQATANEFTIPFDNKIKDEEVQSLLLLALKRLVNLTIGGLQLDPKHHVESIDLTLPNEELGMVREWPITEKHLAIFFSISELASSVTRLNLASLNLKQVSKVGPAWKALRELDVSGNALGSEDMSLLAESIQHMEVLSKLGLKGNRLVTAEAGGAIGFALKGNTVLKHLVVSSNIWDDRYTATKVDGPGFARGVSEGLSGNETLSFLDVSNSKLVGRGAWTNSLGDYDRDDDRNYKMDMSGVIH
jgi:hypothetical protein